MRKTIVVHGPPGCGKSRNAAALARHFRVTDVVDEFDPVRHRLTPGALHLTNAPGEVAGADNYRFEDIRFNHNLRGPISRIIPRPKRSYAA